MSWFKKLFQKFQQDSDEHETVKLKQEMIRKDTHEVESSKNIQAKISYQYPKGSFRFPIIPDETNPVPNKVKREVRKQQEVHNVPKRSLRDQKVEKYNHRIEPVPLLKKNRKEAPATKDDQPVADATGREKRQLPQVRRSGPFKPTEIPSPIFGYERPNQTKVVEHELSGFFNEKELDKYLKTKEDNNSHFASAQELTEYPIKPIKELTVQEANGEVAAAIEELVALEPVNQPTILNYEDERVADKDTLKSISEGEIIGEDQSDQLVKLEEGNQTQKRSHIPFNVLMLKQDREKLAQKKIRKIEEQQRVKREPNPQNKLETSMKPKMVEQISIDENNEEVADYYFPADSLLMPPVIQESNNEWLQEQELLLNQTLINFNVGAKVVNVTQGPSVTRFEVQPDPGVKVNKITNLTDDIKLSLAARDIRIEAPIPGKHTIGIEVPNQASRPVLISEILSSSQFSNDSSPLTAALGLDISGKPVVTDLKKMPHGLIAGATGSGKSVCINSILVSLLYKAKPEDVKLLLIDPKMVELAPYNHIPHLVSPVITDVKAATAALKWAVDEMERRYELFAHTGVREITRFNELAADTRRLSDKLPYIIIVIDELADLMMVSPTDVEEAICRIAQKARACGIHLVVATQRPSVDVITGLIKANIPTRIAFSVSSQVDSRTIIDISGAEKLLGRGDMLFLENGSSKPVRLQGTYISDIEIDKVVEHVRRQGEPQYLFEQAELLKKAQVIEEEDELFYDACEFIIDQGGASTSSLQRRFKIGYNRAARLMDLMEEQGYISEARGSKPRDVLITEADLDSLQDTSTNH